MIEGTCHCGAVSWRLDVHPESATACNCTMCRRTGGLWAYGHEAEDVHVSGATDTYVWGDKKLALHRCAVCGNIAYWRGFEVDDAGRRRMGVNVRLAEPAAVGAILIDHFDGLETWNDLPSDGKRVADMWF